MSSKNHVTANSEIQGEKGAAGFCSVVKHVNQEDISRKTDSIPAQSNSLEFVGSEAENPAGIKLGVRFGDYDRAISGGNSICFFLFVYSSKGKPEISEMRLRVGADLVSRTSALLSYRDALSSLCPGYEDRAVYAHLCINKLFLPKSAEIDVIAFLHSEELLLGKILVSDNDISSVVRKIDLGCNPLLITSLGRSGSTVLANSLGSHPDIEAWGGYPFEYRFFSYCLHAIAVHTSPANHGFSMGGDSFEVRSPFMIGYNPFNCREYDRLIGRDEVRDFYEFGFVENVADFFLSQFKLFAEKASRKDHRPLVFVEKIAGVRLADMASNLCLNVREIVLIRDFWDMVRSMLSFDSKRNSSSFRDGASKFWLESMAFQYVHLVRRSRREGMIAIAYEDLTTAPKETICEVLKHSNLAVDEAVLVNMLAPFEKSDYKDLHRTSAVRADDIRSMFDSVEVDGAEKLLDLIR